MFFCFFPHFYSLLFTHFNIVYQMWVFTSRMRQHFNVENKTSRFAFLFFSFSHSIFLTFLFHFSSHYLCFTLYTNSIFAVDRLTLNGACKLFVLFSDWQWWLCGSKRVSHPLLLVMFFILYTVQCAYSVI